MSKTPDKSGNCEKCGAWRQVLCRDRIKPKREGGSYDPKNVQWICANCHQDKTALEQSAAHKGRPKSPEQRAKMSAWQMGRPKPAATRQKISDTLTGRKMPDEVRAKISAAHIGRIVSPETGKKISEALKGRKRRGKNCPSGHPYGPDSITRKNGQIVCRICHNEHRRAKRLKDKSEKEAPACLA